MLRRRRRYFLSPDPITSRAMPSARSNRLSDALIACRRANYLRAGVSGDSRSKEVTAEFSDTRIRSCFNFKTCSESPVCDSAFSLSPYSRNDIVSS